MSEIVRVFPEWQRPAEPVLWLILDCGHWLKWTNTDVRQEPGEQIECSGCFADNLTVTTGDVDPQKA